MAKHATRESLEIRINDLQKLYDDKKVEAQQYYQNAREWKDVAEKREKKIEALDHQIQSRDYTIQDLAKRVAHLEGWQARVREEKYGYADNPDKQEPKAETRLDGGQWR